MGCVGAGSRQRRGRINITATDVNSNISANASYSIRSAATAALSISAVSGDGQNGAPGALLTKPLVVVVQDQDGNPAPGREVLFAASPGAVVSPATATTASDGTASATMRLPPSGGIALATAQAGHDVVTFSAVSSAFSLANFPALTQAVDGTLGNGSDTIRKKGALLTAAASLLRYYQQNGSLPQPNGLASPTNLNAFLKSFCSPGTQICDGFIAPGSSTEQTVNLWRVGAFVGDASDVSVESAGPESCPRPGGIGLSYPARIGADQRWLALCGRERYCRRWQHSDCRSFPRLGANKPHQLPERIHVGRRRRASDPGGGITTGSERTRARFLPRGGECANESYLRVRHMRCDVLVSRHRRCVRRTAFRLTWDSLFSSL